MVIFIVVLGIWSEVISCRSLAKDLAHPPFLKVSLPFHIYERLCKL